MILKEDGALALADWGYSGFYPRFFELATLTCVLPYDKEFQPLVKRQFESSLNLTDQEKQDMKLTLCVRGANLRWSTLIIHSVSTLATMASLIILL
ncbi:hypothetical protein N7488_000161 [Penicillium malachiteum]|nr:hypothetical protein N7488_000161 [Penicillium malachiteum]